MRDRRQRRESQLAKNRRNVTPTSERRQQMTFHSSCTTSHSSPPCSAAAPSWKLSAEWGCISWKIIPKNFHCSLLLLLFSPSSSLQFSIVRFHVDEFYSALFLQHHLPGSEISHSSQRKKASVAALSTPYHSVSCFKLSRKTVQKWD